MGATLACCKSSCCKDTCYDEKTQSLEPALPLAPPPTASEDGPEICQISPQPVLSDKEISEKEISPQPVEVPRPVPVVPVVEQPVPEIVTKIKNHPQIRLGKASPHPGQYYLLSQTFALVRHADRLDHTEEWVTYKDRQKYPNDTPLTSHGHLRATQVGHDLKSTGKPFSLIISSPYYRCAQTASRIAEVLRIPIHFDLDIGEVFDTVSMGDIDGGPQHRSPKILRKALGKEFPDVEYVCDKEKELKVEGQQQMFPEPFAGARMRFCYKVKKLVQRAASELMSIVIVSHGDAVAAVLGMLEETWSIRSIAYTSYIVASREVRVLKEDEVEVIEDEPVYPERHHTWKLIVSPGIQYVEAKSAKKQRSMHEQHTQELQLVEEQATEIKTNYELATHHEELFKSMLKHLGSSQEDINLLMNKTKNSKHLATEHEHRMHCAPRSRSLS